MGSLPRHWPALVASSVSYFVAIGVSIAPFEWGWKVPLGAAGLVASGWFSHWQIQQSERAHEEEIARLRGEVAQTHRDLAEASIEVLLRQAQALTGGEQRGARSCLFLVGTDDRLHIAYDVSMQDAPDRGISFARLQGCAGHAWGMNEQTGADLRDANPEILRNVWKLTPDQISLTNHLRGILCTPVRDPDNPDRVIAVHSLDWISDLDPEGLPTATWDQLMDASAVLAGLLRMGGLVE